MLDILCVNARDSVATALRDLAAGETVNANGTQLQVVGNVPRGHKLALRAIAADQKVVKFGFPIGVATQAMVPGEHVHSHNLRTLLSDKDSFEYAFEGGGISSAVDRTFDGYLRADGRAGTRNEIWILPTVGCVSRTAQKIASVAQSRHGDRLDGIFAFTHPHGCSQLGTDLDGTRQILAALACNPNAAGVLLIGLGCESNQVDRLVELIPPESRGKIRTVLAQAEEDEVGAGLALVDSLVAEASLARRTPLPLAKLAIGVKCGGSDGLSGLTANPLVGHITDTVTGAGGSAILTEVPEIFGAEQLLMNRATSRTVYDALVSLIADFKRHFTSHGQPVSENPSPGNIAGGITTLEEKSLGAVQKGGQAPVVDVRRYGERIAVQGLTVLEAPGNDAVSSTALAAAGATLILFTTGRGTPLGFPVPTLKISSNTELAQRKSHWIDFDAGIVLEQGLEIASAKLLDKVIAVASGDTSAAERNEEREIAIWKRGVTL